MIIGLIASFLTAVCWSAFLISFLLTEHPKSPTSPEPEKKKAEEGEDKDEQKKALISEEKAETGRVNFSVMLMYCKAATWYMAISVVLFNALSTGVAVGTNFWLAEWSTAAGNLLQPNNTIQVTACDTTASPVYVLILSIIII